MMSRTGRISNLILAEHALLQLINEQGPVKAKLGRAFVNEIVTKKSRRESVWDSMINTGLIVPLGMGVYDMTPVGRKVLGWWNEERGVPQHVVNETLKKLEEAR